MAKKCLLFTYGLLQPTHTPPRSMSAQWPDRIRGRLYDLGPYPVATDLDDQGVLEWIEGFTIEIDQDELAALDEFEDVDSGEFRRRVIDTEGGHTAWVYEYLLPVPAVLDTQKRWPK